MEVRKSERQVFLSVRILLRRWNVRKAIVVIGCSLLLGLAGEALAGSKGSGSGGSHSVKGYFRKDGTYVAPHHRSNPDASTSNNWSTKGNVNPNTGKPGTIDPQKEPSSPSGIAEPTLPTVPITEEK
jgi:hypothetical protein